MPTVGMNSRVNASKPKQDRKRDVQCHHPQANHHSDQSREKELATNIASHNGLDTADNERDPCTVAAGEQWSAATFPNRAPSMSR